MESKLYKYQLPHFYQLEEIMLNNQCGLDASDTGTGKTYVALALSHSLKMKPLILCPRSVIPSWLSVAKTLGVDIMGISNYELIKGGKYYNTKMEKVECPFLKREFYDEQGKLITDVSKIKATADGVNTKGAKKYVFTPPSDVFVIFDEAHRCKNHRSGTSKLMMSIYESKCKMLLLSATISDKIECFKPFGVIFGFYDDMNKYLMWLRKVKKAREVYYKNKNLTDRQKTLDIIHTKMFPEFGSRMKIKDLGTMFPSNQVLSQAYMSNNQEEIQKQYDIIEEAFRDLKQKWSKSDGLGKLVRARMKIEMLKVPIMLDIIEEALDSNYSVAVFVNYKDTMNYLAYYFETECLIHGDQTMDERQDSIDRFQSNNSKIIISIIQAGGVGISLHDIHGGHPRMSVISPTWSGQDMQQVLGRVHRAGSKSPALQRIVYCAGTYEERICELIQNKLTNLSAINDRDLLGPNHTEEVYKEVDKNIGKILNEHGVNQKDDNDVDTDKDTDKDINKEKNKETDTNDNADRRNNTKNTKKKKYKNIVDRKEKRLFVKDNS